MGDDLCTQIIKWPKIDLHRHLEGSVRLQTLSEIAQEYNIDLPGYDLDAIRPLVQITNEPRTHQHFLDKFRVLRTFFKNQYVVERVAYEAVEDAVNDNIRYLELRFTPSALAEAGGFSLEQVINWVIQAVRLAENEFDITVGLIVSVNRHEPVALGERVLAAAGERLADIDGLDLAGDEATFPALPFAPLFSRAKEMGLGITIHAGEWNSPDNIIFAIKHLYADRIGHGVRAIEDPQTWELLKQRGIPLEICPTSNYQSGAVHNSKIHPLSELINLGLVITINTDDPCVSGITLTDEYCLAVTELGLSIQDLKTTMQNTAKAAFLKGRDKDRLVKQFEKL